MTEVMKAWEALSDEERLTWDIAGKPQRMKGIHYFKQVNLRRLRRGEELARVPARSKPHDGRPLLKRVDIGNRDGRITLELELRRVPDAPRTVWASLPCNLGLKKPSSCPRLGWLPAPQSRWSEITKLYFANYGEYIKEHGLQLAGKRIFIRLRQETDDGPNLYEQVRAVVPQPKVQMSKKSPVSSNELRTSFEGSSKHHGGTTLATGRARASGWRGMAERPGMSQTRRPRSEVGRRREVPSFNAETQRPRRNAKQGFSAFLRGLCVSALEVPAVRCPASAVEGRAGGCHLCPILQGFALTQWGRRARMAALHA